MGKDDRPPLRVQIASPCQADWGRMVGDDRRRFCEQCQKHVYDLSELRLEEARALLAASGQAPCVRLYRRVDGTVLTEDCPVGLAWLRRRGRAAWLRARVLLLPLASALLGAGVSACKDERASNPASSYESPRESRPSRVQRVLRSLFPPPPLMGAIRAPEPEGGTAADAGPG